MSFLEYLLATANDILVEQIVSHKSQESISEPIHNKILSILGQYLAIGGMPAVVQCFIKTKDPSRCFALQHSLIDTYRQDFSKYAKPSLQEYLKIVFKGIFRVISENFKYSKRSFSNVLFT